ncbi:MAG: 50S ribosomal protein L25 [Candidatus Bipolaricaulia bacterium]
MYRLEAEERQKANPRELRRRGLVPAVIYGHGLHRLIQIKRGELEKLLGKITRSSRITLALDGEEWETFIKEIQYDPLTDRVLHVDFYLPSAERPIKLEVPVLLRGEPEGRKFGGVLRRLRTKISVKGLPERIPEKIELDVSPLDVGDSLRVRDIRLEEVEILTPPEIPLAIVKVPRRAIVQAAAEAEAAAAAEAEAEEAAAAAEAGEGAEEEESEERS